MSSDSGIRSHIRITNQAGTRHTFQNHPLSSLHRMNLQIHLHTHHSRGILNQHFSDGISIDNRSLQTNRIPFQGFIPDRFCSRLTLVMVNTLTTFVDRSTLLNDA